MKGTKLATAAAVLALGSLAGHANADVIPYPNVGSPNPTTYSFTAASSGPLTVYEYATSSAGDSEVVGVLDNGVQLGGLGLNDHSTSAGASSYTFGNVTAGDTLTFFIVDYSTSTNWYSDPSMNPGNENHIYSAYYSGDNPNVPGDVPAGVYVAFEDRAFGDSDLNYQDEQFVFANTASEQVPAPEPMSLVLVGTGLMGLGWLRGRRKS